MRFVVIRTSPVERGTVPESWTMHYASRENVIRYGLARKGVAAGSFDIYGDDGIVTPAYKRVGR